MANIQVDVESSRAVNVRLPSITNTVCTVKISLSRLQSSVDARVLNSNNLRLRLRNAHKDVAYIEGELQHLHRTIVRFLNQYEETEQTVNSMVSNENVGNVQSAPTGKREKYSQRFSFPSKH